MVTPNALGTQARFDPDFALWASPSPTNGLQGETGTGVAHTPVSGLLSWRYEPG